ncbi:hypothetical protein, partial [Kutzneria kofuensis]|uniref:hypothetical protein n=1 Tax=Kutzneria kofuensis TaxID=103725 RepID=UPI0031EE74C4
MAAAAITPAAVGGSPIDWAERAAEAARKAAYERALRITQAARDAAEDAAKHTAIAVGSAATTAVMNMPTLVSSTPTAAAAIVDTIENVVADNRRRRQKIYRPRSTPRARWSRWFPLRPRRKPRPTAGGTRTAG